jgi:hypothetical protein
MVMVSVSSLVGGGKLSDGGDLEGIEVDHAAGCEVAGLTDSNTTC